MTAEKVCQWLLEKSVLPIDYVVPVKVMLGKHEFVGARYGVREVYKPTERAVTEGVVTAGEPYIQHRFYLLGEVPSFKQRNVCFTWTNTLPIDNRVYTSVGEWYVSGYYQQPEKNEHHPFGKMFLLAEWLSHTYGFYKGHKIDTLERYTYLRIPMTVA